MDKTVLAVEDNGNLRRVVIRQLNDLGYRVIEAHDGASALRTLESSQVDLRFIDVVMPGGWNGYTLAKHALERWPALKVLITSGFPETRLGTDSEASGNMRLITKPYRKDDLASAVREILDAKWSVSVKGFAINALNLLASLAVIGNAVASISPACLGGRSLSFRNRADRRCQLPSVPEREPQSMIAKRQRLSASAARPEIHER